MRIRLVVLLLGALVAPALVAQPDDSFWLDTFAVPGVYLGGENGLTPVNAIEPDGTGGYFIAGIFHVVDDVEAHHIAH
jgi:hypothetical protein